MLHFQGNDRRIKKYNEQAQAGEGRDVFDRPLSPAFQRQEEVTEPVSQSTRWSLFTGAQAATSPAGPSQSTRVACHLSLPSPQLDRMLRLARPRIVSSAAVPLPAGAPHHAVLSRADGMGP